MEGDGSCRECQHASLMSPNISFPGESTNHMAGESLPFPGGFDCILHELWHVMVVVVVCVRCDMCVCRWGGMLPTCVDFKKRLTCLLTLLPPAHTHPCRETIHPIKEYECRSMEKDNSDFVVCAGVKFYPYRAGQGRCVSHCYGLPKGRSQGSCQVSLDIS